MKTTPADKDFNDLFHELYFVVSQDNNALQVNKDYSKFQEWMAVFVEVYGSFLNTPQSANNLSSFANDNTFEIDLFTVPPGGFNSFNTFFCRHIRPGKRPIGTITRPYIPPSPGHPVGPSPDPEEDIKNIHENMNSDTVILVPADSVFKGSWHINEKDYVKVSKGNTYPIEELLAGSKYSDCFKDCLFTHSYLTVFTYHRYHVPVRGKVLETSIVSGEVYAHVDLEDGHLSATDGEEYQFKQDRAIMIIDNPVIGKVAMIPIGMDFVSSCNLSVNEGDYLNKGDEFGYFLFGGSDMIMLFANPNIKVDLKIPQKVPGEKQKYYFYKLGQVFGRLS
ncbi:MAG: phosphatidylserine decarboxylase [Thermodesulfobacteriota bacterium]|nr:phosphatidylserine decarboxylase [Thermodesulfobacteriota bacterium]